MYKKSGFTIAEILIVLVVIGVLASLFLPQFSKMKADDKYLNFKNANAMLYQAINQMLGSDKYFLDDDMGRRNNGQYIDGTHEGDYTYFCNVFADVIPHKTVSCKTVTGETCGNLCLSSLYTIDASHSVVDAKKQFDKICKDKTSGVDNEIIMPNGTVFYQAGLTPFGESVSGNRVFTYGDFLTTNADGSESFNFAEGGTYKIFCVDVDGDADVNDEDPFGYGIRVDGHFLPGERADEWAGREVKDQMRD